MTIIMFCDHYYTSLPAYGIAILIENCNRLENKMDNPFHEMCNYTFDYADANMQSEKH